MEASPQPNNPATIGYRTHWHLVIQYGLLIAFFQIGGFYLTYTTGWADKDLISAGLYGFLLAWVPTLGIYYLTVAKVRQLDGGLTTYRGFYYVLLLAFLWLSLDTANAILFEYRIDPDYDQQVLERSLEIAKAEVTRGVVNEKAASKYILEIERQIALAKAGPQPIGQMIASNFSFNLVFSSVVGLVLGVLMRPYVRR